MSKKENGITLIALAVTIIVLIILAGISITSLTGKKGLINQARTNSENAQKESIIEKIEADLLKEKTKTGNTPSKEDLKKIIEENGYNYDVTVEIGNFEFPTKTYGDISLPSGYYDALRVKIGEAKGQNWWCVMFPPLCFIDVSSGVVPDESKETLKNTMSEEDYALISENDSNKGISFKFKILEFFGNNNFITAKN